MVVEHPEEKDLYELERLVLLLRLQERRYHARIVQGSQDESEIELLSLAQGLLPCSRGQERGRLVDPLGQAGQEDVHARVQAGRHLLDHGRGAAREIHKSFFLRKKKKKRI